MSEVQSTTSHATQSSPIARALRALVLALSLGHGPVEHDHPEEQELHPPARVSVTASA